MTSGEDDSESEEREGSQDERPEQMESRRRLAEHKPDAYSVGYDETGDTRVGIGRADGDIEQLVRHNEGRHRSDGSHSAREAARDKRRITDSFCSALDIPAHQKEEALDIVSRLDLDRFGSQKRLEKVALCVIQFAVDRSRRRWLLDGRPPEDHDLDSDGIDRLTRYATEPEFKALCREHGVSDADRYSVSQIIKRELKQQGYFDDDSTTSR